MYRVQNFKNIRAGSGSKILRLSAPGRGPTKWSDRPENHYNLHAIEYNPLALPCSSRNLPPDINSRDGAESGQNMDHVKDDVSYAQIHVAGTSEK
uniref:Uncharacterized protein n=1 Tax=Romanomermis culicivorax TaxID=13658 RepID=A0A915KM86_ROMCU